MLKDLFKSDETSLLDPSKLPADEQKAFYGSLFSLAAADDAIDREEMELIFETLDLEHLEEKEKREIHSYVLDPPEFEKCLATLSGSDDALRYGLMLNLIEIMIADDVIDPEEKAYIRAAQEKFEVSDEQVEEMKKFAREVKRIRERGLDDAKAADALKQAASSLTAVGVPIGAVALSGSVVGLSAAGITSGLAALGVGLGMVPGIGIAILLGAGIYVGLNKIFDTGDKKKKQKLQKERQRKAQLAIQNLQETIATLIEQLQELQESAADADANKEAIQTLNQRLKKLKGLLNRREREANAAA